MLETMSHTIPHEVQQRAQKLRELLDYHRYRYHVLDAPEISDEAYDSLFKELVVLEEQYPSLKSPLSPTSRVGDEPLAQFEKVEHQVRQWSFSDTWVNLHDDLQFLDSGDFIWASERDGFKRLYLHGRDGALKHALTPEGWVVDNLLAVDEHNDRVFFASGGRPSTE